MSVFFTNTLVLSQIISRIEVRSSTSAESIRSFGDIRPEWCNMDTCPIQQFKTRVYRSNHPISACLPFSEVKPWLSSGLTIIRSFEVDSMFTKSKAEVVHR